jgi:hypothetical protein
MILDRAVTTLEATRSMRVRAQLRKLQDAAHADAFCRINEAALLFFNLRTKVSARRDDRLPPERV